MIDNTEKYCFIRTLSNVGRSILLGNDELLLFKKKKYITSYKMYTRFQRRSLRTRIIYGYCLEHFLVVLFTYII